MLYMALVEYIQYFAVDSSHFDFNPSAWNYAKPAIEAFWRSRLEWPRYSSSSSSGLEKQAQQQ